jgi:hypothetical protein
LLYSTSMHDDVFCYDCEKSKVVVILLSDLRT